MDLNRFDDAPLLAFHKFLAERANAPFAWGTNDCASFASDGIQAISGTDLIAEFRGRYNSALGAYKTAKAVTGSSDLLEVVSSVAAKNNLQKRQNPLTAMRGDLVLAEQADGKLICALVGLTGRWCHAPGELRLQNICISSVRHAWTY